MERASPSGAEIVSAPLTEEALPGWRFETLYPDYAQGHAISRVLYDEKSDQQHVQLVETRRFGRMLLLDGVVQTTEADEHVYHEMLAHTPILAHGSAKRVLIIGGGDGGMLREVSRHAGVEAITMVEIDAAVVEFSKKYLPTLSAGAFDDPRLELVIEDAAAYVKRVRKKFDVIIADRPDPIGPGAALFTKSFYSDCRARLRKGGVLVTQGGVPFLQADELREDMALFSALFEDYAAYIAAVPTYNGGLMAFGWGCDTPRRRLVAEKTLEKRYAEAGLTTRYYTPALHKAAFALPRFIEELVPRREEG
ncbi:MAG: polyamine aminopropyltransferase [Pseudomonadota bacterium]